jgi:hypothetical protein
MQFEWDEAKNLENIRKHGLTSQMFLICLMVLCWLSLMNALTMAKTVRSESAF